MALLSPINKECIGSLLLCIRVGVLYDSALFFQQGAYKLIKSQQLSVQRIPDTYCLKEKLLTDS